MGKRTAIGHIEKITAYDHWSQAGWSDLKSCEPLTITAVGTVVKEDKLYVYLASLVSEHNEIGRLSGMVKSCIIKRTKIKGGQ